MPGRKLTDDCVAELVRRVALGAGESPAIRDGGFVGDVATPELLRALLDPEAEGNVAEIARQCAASGYDAHPLWIAPGWWIAAFHAYTQEDAA